ncbi:MAG: hypothetical protein ABI782_03040 [Anaerolineaceae bacterium]
MTDFAAKAPFNPEKPNELHARESMPAAPDRSRADVTHRFLGLGLGIVGTFIFLTLAFQARAGWHNHREWVVAMTVPGSAIAGVCFGYLLARQQFKVAMWGVGLLAVSILFTVYNIVQGAIENGPSYERDLLTILAGVFLVLAGHAFVIAEVWVELKHPTRAPLPEA